MATFKFTGTITVYDARSKKDAINQLQVMLNDYEDMNPDNKEIIIQWNKVERVDKNHFKLVKCTLFSYTVAKLLKIHKRTFHRYQRANCKCAGCLVHMFQHVSGKQT